MEKRNDGIQIKQIDFEQTWHIRHKVMYPNLPFDSIKLENDSEGIHFGLFVYGSLTSVISLFHQHNKYQFRKLATVEDSQKMGYGTLLLSHVIEYVKETQGMYLWCNARSSKALYYNKFGFRDTGVHFSKNDLDFVIMELELSSHAER